MRTSSPGDRLDRTASFGWTNLESLIALTIILIAFGAIAGAARQALAGAARVNDRVAAVIEERNETVRSIVALF
jgi:hypothetical protein